MFKLSTQRAGQTSCKRYLFDWNNRDSGNKVNTDPCLFWLLQVSFTWFLIENHESTTLVDNIFVNNTKENYKCGNLFTDLSDHLPVFLKTINLQRFKHHNAIDTKSRFLNDKTINHLCQDLENIDWKNAYSQSDAQVAYKHFYSKLYGLFDKNIPLIKPCSKNPGEKIPWITKGILKSSITKNMLYEKFMNNPTERNKSIYYMAKTRTIYFV